MKFELKNRFTASVIFTAEIEASDSTPLSIKLGLAVRKAIEAKADLSWANLSKADLSWANLSKANLSKANLSKADLSEADLSKANLSWADLSEANLSEANLSKANLSWANLSKANLSEADLSKADLSWANLSKADLSKANLSKADLSKANLSWADLSKANLSIFRNDFWSILLQNQHEVPGLLAALREGRVDGSTYTGECACLVGTIANVRGVPVNNLQQDSNRPAECWFLMISKGDKPGDKSGGGFAAQKAVEWADEFCGYAGIVIPVPETESAL